MFRMSLLNKPMFCAFLFRGRDAAECNGAGHRGFLVGAARPPVMRSPERSCLELSGKYCLVICNSARSIEAHAPSRSGGCVVFYMDKSLERLSRLRVAQALAPQIEEKLLSFQRRGPAKCDPGPPGSHPSSG